MTQRTGTRKSPGEKIVKDNGAGAMAVLSGAAGSRIEYPLGNALRSLTCLAVLGIGKPIL
jgi:hypothetical protein